MSISHCVGMSGCALGHGKALSGLPIIIDMIILLQSINQDLIDEYIFLDDYIGILIRKLHKLDN